MAKKKSAQKQSISTPKRTKKSNVPDLIIESGFWKKNAIPALILFVLSIALYIQTRSFDYVLDDKIVYHENGLVKKGFDGIAEIFGTESMVGYFGEQVNLLPGSRYRPLSIATFAIEHEFFGQRNYKIENYWTKEFKKNPIFANRMDKIIADGNLFEVIFPDEESFIKGLNTYFSADEINQNKEQFLFHAGYSDSGISHMINVLLYGLLVLLLFRLMSVLFPVVQSKWYLTLAFVSTLLFVLHPIHVEAVANVKGRDEILALTGALATMFFTLKYIANEKPIHLVLSGIIFLFGLLAKEHVLTFIALIPLTTYFFTNSSFKKNAISVIPLAIASLIFLYMRNEAIGGDNMFNLSGGTVSRDLMNNPFVEMSAGEALATKFYTLGLYVKLLLFPHPLTHDYYPYHIPIMTWGNISTILSFLLYAGMGIFGVLGLRKKSIPAYGIFFFLIPLFAVSNLVVSVGTFMNDRFVFFSSVGFCIILAYLISRKLPSPVINLGLLSILVLGYFAKTITRVSDWENGYTLNVSAIQNSPNSARANLYMSTALFKKEVQRETNREKKLATLQEVKSYVDRSLEIHPDYGSAIKMQVKVATDIYRIDSKIQPLLQTFESIIRVRKTNESIDIYLNHFKKNNSWTRELTAFSYKVGYEYLFKQLGDRTAAAKYINYGLSISPNDASLLQAAAELRGQ
ncbi:MAG: hypothetical protein AB8F94_24385 [Saprospiraceae bacterium]